MTIEFGDLNWLAIVVVAVAGYALGGAWYGVFATPWMAEVGLTREKIKAAGARNYLSYAIAAVAYFVGVLSVAVVMQWAGASGAVDGLLVGLMLGVGFFGLLLITIHSYTLRSIKLMGIDLYTPLVTFAIGGLVLGVWD